MIRTEHEFAVDSKHERRDQHIERPPARLRALMIERADVRADTRQIHAYLLVRLANRRRDQRRVGRILVSAGERHVTGPWVALLLGAANEQQIGHFAAVVLVHAFTHPLTQDHRNCRLSGAGPDRRPLGRIRGHATFDVG